MILVKESGQNVGRLGIVNCKGGTQYQVSFLNNERFGKKCMYNHAVVVDPMGKDWFSTRWVSCGKTERHMEERRNKRLNMEKKGQTHQNHAAALSQGEPKSELENGGDDASFQP